MVRGGRWWLSCLLAGLWPAVASAGVELQVTPPGAACIGAEELEAQVVAWLDRGASAGILAESRATVALSDAGEGWTATIEVETPKSPGSARRQISTAARDCRDLDAALVVALGALLDPEEREALDSEPGDRPAERDPEPALPIAIEPAVPPSADVASRSRAATRPLPGSLLVSSSGGILIGALGVPRSSWSSAMRAPLRRRFDLRGAVDYTPIPTSIDVEEAKVHFSLAGAKLLGCWVATQTPASLLDTRARSTLKTKGAWASKTSRSVSTSSSSAPGAPVLFRRRSARFA